MIDNFYFVINDEDETFELWVNEELITDCFSLEGSGADLMKQLIHYANVPCYERRRLSFEEVQNIT